MARATAAVSAASSSELAKRGPISWATGRRLISDTPGSPVQQAGEPAQVALVRRQVEAERLAQAGTASGDTDLAQDRLGRIARQDVGADGKTTTETSSRVEKAAQHAPGDHSQHQHGGRPRVIPSARDGSAPAANGDEVLVATLRTTEPVRAQPRARRSRRRRSPSGRRSGSASGPSAWTYGHRGC